MIILFTLYVERELKSTFHIKYMLYLRSCPPANFLCLRLTLKCYTKQPFISQQLVLVRQLLICLITIYFGNTGHITPHFFIERRVVGYVILCYNFILASFLRNIYNMLLKFFNVVVLVLLNWARVFVV